MGEYGNVVAQSFVDKNLTWGVGKMVVAADNVADLHVCVVAHYCEVVGGCAIGANQDHVVHDVGRERHMAVYGIVEFDGAVVLGNLEAPYVGFACIDATLCFFGVNTATGAVVAGVAAFGLFGFGAFCGDFFLGAEAGIYGALFLQFFKSSLVGVETLGLQVGAELAANFGAFVPIQAEPLHRTQDNLLVFLGGALRVGVFDAKNEGAAHGAGERPVIDSGTCSADVQLAGGRGGETDTNRLRLVCHQAHFLSSRMV